MILDCEECTASLCSSREKLCIFGLYWSPKIKKLKLSMEVMKFIIYLEINPKDLNMSS